MNQFLVYVQLGTSILSRETAVLIMVLAVTYLFLLDLVSVKKVAVVVA